MRCERCGECCKGTEMLLSNKDIERLERKGYERNSFVHFNEDGYAVLQNINGVCFFFNPERQKCRERETRPEGCRIYPIMHDEEKGIVIDSICPVKDTITKEQKARKGKEVLRLLARIDSEAEKRRQRKNKEQSC